MREDIISGTEENLMGQDFLEKLHLVRFYQGKVEIITVIWEEQEAEILFFSPPFEQGRFLKK